MKAKNKVFVVTGGASGVGRALTLQLLSEGAGVAIVDINEAGMRETGKLAGDWAEHLSMHHIDVSDRKKVHALPQAVIERHGTVDAIINNAGIIQPFITINDLDYPDIERVINTNFYGPVHMIKAFLPHLLQRPEAHIVNVSSMGGFLPVPGQSIYGSSKAALKLMSDGLFAELSGTRVKVTVVLPGAMNTNIMENSGLEMPDEVTQQAYRMLSAEKAAQLIISGMEKDRCRVIIGMDSRSMNFLTRLNPTFASKMIIKKMKDLLV